tara:strand:- start:31 stop:459 length:429 start_codon:yes stop_codon:yes gene_type:complete
MNRLVNAFVIYKFIKLLVLPFERTDAYKLGIIDKDGNYLKYQRDLKTPQEKLASNIFTRLVWKIKKILMKVPIVKTKLGTLATALWLIKEEAQKVGADPEIVQEAFFQYLVEEHDIDIKEELILEEAKILSNKENIDGMLQL